MNKYRLISVLLLVGILLAACKPAEEIVAEPLTVTEEETANTTEPTDEPQVVEETDELIASEPAECRVLQDPVFPYPYVDENDWSMGPEDAAVTIIVYTDIQCPACAYYHPAYEALYEAHAEDTRLVIRHFPLDYHANAQVAAQAAESIGLLNGFEDMNSFITDMFANQADWQEKEAADFLAYVTDIATSQFEIEAADFEEMLTSQTVIDNISDDFNGGLGFITGTPWIMINGIPLMYMPVGSFEEAYQFALAVPEIQYDACPEMTIDLEKQYFATVETTKGSFVMELLPQSAPFTVNSFVFLANDGYYDGVPFHRVIPEFVAQAGDFTGTGIFGPGYEYDIEIDPNLSYDQAGVVGMANSGSDKNGSQFFITYSAQQSLDGGYTIFGNVTEGMDVVEALQAIGTENDAEGVQPDFILSVSIEEK